MQNISNYRELRNPTIIISILFTILVLFLFFSSVQAETISISLMSNQSIEFTNYSGSSFKVTSTGYYDYVIYDMQTGAPDYANNRYSSLTVNSGKRVIITNPNSSSITISSSSTAFNPVITQDAALYKFTLEAGKSYEFTNTSATDDRDITNNNVSFDYVKKTASGSVSWGNDKTYVPIYISAGGTTKVTANADISCWYPRELFVQDVSYVEIEETALYEFTLEAGKTYEFVNTTSSTINITNSSSSSGANRYDYFRFDQNSNLSTGKSVYGSILIYTGGRTVVYVPGTNNIYGWYPRDIFEAYVTFNETEKLDLVYPTDIVHSFYQNGVNTHFDNFYGGYANNSSYSEISDLSLFLLGQDSDGSFVSLPRGSYTVLGFKQPIVNKQGIFDLFIKGSGAAYEEAEVFVSSVDGVLHYLGTVTENKEIMSLELDDADIAQPIIAVMIIGMDEGGACPGFDVTEVSGFTNPDVQISASDIENAYEIIREFLMGRLPSKWSAKAPMITARTDMGIALANEKIYAIGGENYLTDGVLDSIEEYDPQADVWSEKSGKLQSPRLGFGTASVNSKIYTIGGSNNGCSAIVEEYDPALDLMTYKAPMQTARYGVAAIENDGKIYAIGGVDESGFLNTVEEYDPLTDTWVYKANMPTDRAGIALASVDKKIYAIGGHNADESYLDTVEVYDPASDTWTSLETKLPICGTGCKAGVMDGKIYVIGGWNGSYIEDIAEYNPTTGMWRVWEGLRIPRTGIGVTALNNMIYVIGGNDFIEGRYSKLVNVFEGAFL